MGHQSLVDWGNSTLPPMYKTEATMLFLDAIQKVVINNIDAICNELNYPYKIVGIEKYIFMNDQIHILIRWIYKDLLLGDKNIGETVSIFSPSSMQFDVNGSLIINAMEVAFTSQHLMDFKSIIAHLTIKIKKLLEKISASFADQSRAKIPTRSETPFPDINLPQPPKEAAASMSSPKKSTPVQNKIDPVTSIPIPTVKGKKAKKSSKSPSKTFAVPAFSQSPPTEPAEMMNKMGVADVNAAMESDNENVLNQMTEELFGGEPKSEAKIPSLPQIPKTTKIPSIPKMSITSIRGKKR